MKRLSTKILGLAALPFFACDTAPAVELEADAGARSGALVSDVVVAHFEVRAAEPKVVPVAPPEVVPVAVAVAAPVTEVADAGAIAPADSVLAPPPIAGRWLVDAGRLVLAHNEGVQDAWQAGEPRLDKKPGKDGDGLFVATVDVAKDALPATFAALAGGEVRVFDHDSEVCVARVLGADALRIEAKLVHLPDDWGDEGDAPSVPEHDALSVFTSGVTVLTAGLEPIMGDCSTGLWAAPVDGASPVLFREARVTPKLERQAVAAFKKLGAWRDAQVAMTQFFNDPIEQARLSKVTWDTMNGTKHDVKLYRSVDGARELALVHANSNEGCGSEGQELVTLFERRGEGKDASFTELGSVPWQSLPAALVDLEGDGTVELLYEGGHGAGARLVIERWHADKPVGTPDNDWKNERQEVLFSLEVPDVTMYGCGC